jgi:hypothetical protein
MAVIALSDLSILGVVVQPHDRVPVVEEFLNEVATDESGRAGNKYLHVNGAGGRKKYWVFGDTDRRDARDVKDCRART